MPNKGSGAKLDPPDRHLGTDGRLLSGRVVDRNADLVVRVDREVVRILLDAPEEQRDVRVVPRNRLPQLHQQKLAIETRVGSIADPLGDIDARVTLAARPVQDDPHLAQPIQPPPTLPAIGGRGLIHARPRIAAHRRGRDLADVSHGTTRRGLITLRHPPHGWPRTARGAVWFATPSPYDSCIRHNLSAFPGAPLKPQSRVAIFLALSERVIRTIIVHSCLW